MTVEKLSEAACRAAMAAGEFPESVRTAAPRVAVVLTQGWCPQWTYMKRYLARAPEAEGRAVFLCVYDEEPFYEDFMAFKESTFHNPEIPYIRYYRDGELRAEGNFIGEEGFFHELG